MPAPTMVPTLASTPAPTSVLTPAPLPTASPAQVSTGNKRNKSAITVHDIVPTFQMRANPDVECWFGRRRTFKRKLPSCVTLKSQYGKYLRAWPNGHVAFTASAAQSDEKFQVMGGKIA